MTKYEELAENIIQNIPRWLEAGQKKIPSENQLCEAFCLSRQTVRQALLLLEEKKLIRREKGSGTYLTGLLPAEEHNRISLLLTTDTEYIYPELLGDITRSLSAEGFSVDVRTTQRSLRREREQLLELLADPPRVLIAEGCHNGLPSPSLDLYRQLENEGTKLLFLYGTFPNFSDCLCVQDDNVQGGYEITRHLLTQNHTQIAGIFQSDTAQGRERYSGYLEALRTFRGELPENTILWFDDRQLHDLQTKQDTRFLRSFLRDRLMSCTSVVCYNDEIAYYLIRELRRASVRIPGEISVVGFDNSYLRRSGDLILTTMAHAGKEPCRSVIETVLKLVRGENPASTRISWQLLPGNTVQPL